MKSLFNSSDNVEIEERINKLAPGARSQWGKMDAAQMMAHSNTTLKVAFGELKLKRGLMGMLFGGIAKKKLTGAEPFDRNLPTDRNFVVADRRNFEEEKRTLLALVKRFAQAGPGGITQEAHPFFGKMSPEEWDRLTWNHLDHHLRQFGA